MKGIIFKSFICLTLLFFLNNALADSIDNLKQHYKRPATIPFPQDNPYSLNKATLGKMLFFDSRLSQNQNMSCATCHNPSFGWENAVAQSVGSQNTKLGRHSPTAMNMAWGEHFFWDGRAETLAEQALGPIQAAVEMNMTLEEVVNRLEKVQGYQTLFRKVFDDGITAQNIGKSIATFERTLVSGEAPFDRWIEGDESAISDKAKQGFLVFNQQGHCADCHSGWNFTDNQFHDIGLYTEDVGRYGIDPSTEKNRYAFKTPSLRNIVQRAPYMHHGQLADLKNVIIHYVTGGIERASLSHKMKPVPLSSEQIEQLEAFLDTLQGEDQEMPLPVLPL